MTRYLRSTEFPQYPHNQEKTMFTALKNLFTRKPAQPPVTTATHRSDVDAAIRDAIAQSRAATRQRRIDAIMGLSEDDLVRENEIHDRAVAAINAQDEQERQEREQRTMERRAAAMAAYGETRRKEALKRAKKSRGVDPGTSVTGYPYTAGYGYTYDPTPSTTSGSCYDGGSSSSSSSYDSGSSGSCDSGSSF